jgi:hypothetical protein
MQLRQKETTVSLRGSKVVKLPTTSGAAKLMLPNKHLDAVLCKDIIDNFDVVEVPVIIRHEPAGSFLYVNVIDRDRIDADG